MVGKSTCGSGATGRSGNAAMPATATAIVNSEVATGRRMNGSEIFTALARRLRGLPGTRLDARAGFQPALALDNDPFTWRQPLRDDRDSVVGRRRLDDARFGRIVGLDDPHVKPLRAALQRRRWDRHGIAARVDQRANPHELAGPESLVGVGETCLQADRAGGLVDLFVEHAELALGQLLLVVLIPGAGRDRSAQHSFAHIEQALLRQRENDRRRSNLGDDGQRVRIAGADDVAAVELSQPDPAIDRGYDRGVAELNAGSLDRGLVGVDGGLELVDLGLLLIDRLLRNGLALHQRLRAGEVLLGGWPRRLGLGLVG